MAFDENIDDVMSYNHEMRKALMDKLFFLDKIDVDVIVDYGCADGALISFVEKMFPKIKCIGYDISEVELSIAAQNVKSPLFSDWKKLEAYLKANYSNKKIAVVCNSLIHEVYSYSSFTAIDIFWKSIFSDLFDYIVIRDMMLNEKSHRRSDFLSETKVRKSADSVQLADFESKWGSICDNKNLIHYIMKYRYESNWAREVNENYLPLTFESVLKIIPQSHEITFVDHFTLDFLRKDAIQKFDVHIQDNTHAKFILRRK